MLAQEWREDADALEADPGIMRLFGKPEEFRRALYEAVCAHDGTVAAELDRELDAEFGDEDE